MKVGPTPRWSIESRPDPFWNHRPPGFQRDADTVAIPDAAEGGAFDNASHENHAWGKGFRHQGDRMDPFAGVVNASTLFQSK